MFKNVSENMIRKNKRAFRIPILITSDSGLVVCSEKNLNRLIAREKIITKSIASISISTARDSDFPKNHWTKKSSPTPSKKTWN
jgi:hypothetical protein